MTSSPSPFFSVIINNFNYGRYLKQAIDSVLTQTFQDYELIVVDDHSTDLSLDILRLYQDRLTLIQMPENRGQMAVFNEGVAHANGKYVCILDADDVFLAHKLQKLYETILSVPTADLIQHQFHYVDEGLEICSPAYPFYMRSGNLSHLCVKHGMLTYSPTYCYKNSFLKSIMPINLPLMDACGDHPPAMLAHLLGTIHSIHQPLMLYRLHGKNASHTAKQRNAVDPKSLVKMRLDVEKVYLCVNNVLQTIGSPIRIDLDKSIAYQRYRYVLGEERLWRLFLNLLKTPAIQGFTGKLEFFQTARQWRKGVKREQSS